MVGQVIECVQCGACCKKVPCGFGEWNADKTQCAHLVVIEEQVFYKRYACGLYDHIIKQPGAEIMPAFGAGCCRSLFNEDRDLILYYGLTG